MVAGGSCSSVAESTGMISQRPWPRVHAALPFFLHFRHFKGPRTVMAIDCVGLYLDLAHSSLWTLIGVLTIGLPAVIPLKIHCKHEYNIYVNT